MSGVAVSTLPPMNQERRRLAWLASLCFFLLLIPPAKAAERLVIISPHWEGIKFEFGRAFSVWHKAHYGESVEIDWRDLGGTSDDQKFVISEFSQRPDGIGIDLFFGGGIDPFYELVKRGLLQEYRPSPDIIDKIPHDIGGMPVYDPEFRWFGAALSSFGIIYNKRVLEINRLPQVHTWQELAQLAPAGWVGSGDPRNSGSVHMIYEMILQRYGWDEGWGVINRLASKMRAFDRSSSSTAKDVTTGNTAYALAIDFYAITQIAYAGKDNVGFVLPADCLTINPDGIAILRGAPHLPLAQRFIDFVLSESGQKLLMLPRGHAEGAQQFSIERMSILPELYSRYRDITLVPINPYDQTASFRYDPKKGSARWDMVNGIIGATIIDVHAELVAAWKNAGDTSRAEELGQPPITEAQATDLARGEWKNPVYRQRTLIEWQQWAKRKFRTGS